MTLHSSMILLVRLWMFILLMHKIKALEPKLDSTYSHRLQRWPHARHKKKTREAIKNKCVNLEVVLSYLSMEIRHVLINLRSYFCAHVVLSKAFCKNTGLYGHRFIRLYRHRSH